MPSYFNLMKSLIQNSDNVKVLRIKEKERLFEHMVNDVVSVTYAFVDESYNVLKVLSICNVLFSSIYILKSKKQKKVRI